MSLTLVYSPAADLDAIFNFLAADNPSRARTDVQEIQEACRSLLDVPPTGIGRPDIRLGLSLLSLWRRIVIAYERPGDRVDILRIVSHGQDHQTLMRQ